MIAAVASGQVIVTGTAAVSGSSLKISGVTSKSVKLTWGASPASIPPVTVTGYNVYRSTTTGGPYQKISPIAILPSGNLVFTDINVNHGTTYYYVTTALGNGKESMYSNQATASP